MTARLFSASQDLHEFVTAYTAALPEDVISVGTGVSPVEDITSVVWRLAAEDRHPMLRFTNVAGFDVDVVTNVFASRTRIARILEVDDTALHDEFQRRATRLMPPRSLPDGPILESVTGADDLDLTRLPLLTHFAGDRAPYITSGIIIAEDADGVGNMSYHRAMVHSRNELATSLHSHGDLWRMAHAAAAAGEPLRVAMVIGGHPLFMLAASARVPAGIDERHVAGGLFEAPLEVVPTPRYGLLVPATADYVLEGVIDPTARAAEGPFGEFTGYSSSRSTNNVLRVETMLSRREPLLLDVVGGNSAEHLNLGRIARESEMAEKLKSRFPGVTAIHYPTSGTHFHCYLRVEPQRVGEARQIMLGLLGWDPYLKTVIAVDDDVDITNDAEVLWAVATHFQPADDLFVVDGLPGSPLDPSSSASGTASRLAIDATRGPAFDGTRIHLSATSLDRAARILRAL